MKQKPETSPALEDLFDQYAPMVYRTALGILKKHDLAEDILQDVFLRCARRQEAGQPVTGSTLRRMAMHLSLNQMRTDRRRAHRENAGTVLPLEFEGDTTEKNEQLNAVQQALSCLDDKLRVPLVLKFFNKMTLRDIAKALDIPLGTINSRVNKGLDNMKVELKHKGMMSVVPLLTSVLSDLGSCAPANLAVIKDSIFSVRRPPAAPVTAGGMSATHLSKIFCGVIAAALVGFLVWNGITEDGVTPSASEDEGVGVLKPRKDSLANADDSNMLKREVSDVEHKPVDSEKKALPRVQAVIETGGDVSVRLSWLHSNKDMVEDTTGRMRMHPMKVQETRLDLALTGSLNAESKTLKIESTQITLKFTREGEVVSEVGMTDGSAFSVSLNGDRRSFADYSRYVTQLLGKETNYKYGQVVSSLDLHDGFKGLYRLAQVNPKELPSRFSGRNQKFDVQEKKNESDEVVSRTFKFEDAPSTKMKLGRIQGFLSRTINDQGAVTAVIERKRDVKTRYVSIAIAGYLEGKKTPAEYDMQHTTRLQVTMTSR